MPWSTGTSIAKTKAPANATDCHHHIYSSRFKVDPTSVLRPGDASVADYRLLQKRTGTSRNVIVQPSTYGVFNDGLVEALGEFGPTARGVAVVNTSVTDDELKRLDAARVRGIRFNLATGGATSVDMIEPLGEAHRAARLAHPDELHRRGDGRQQGLVQPPALPDRHARHARRQAGHPGIEAGSARLLIRHVRLEDGEIFRGQGRVLVAARGLGRIPAVAAGDAPLARPVRKLRLVFGPRGIGRRRQDGEQESGYGNASKHGAFPNLPCGREA